MILYVSVVIKIISGGIVNNVATTLREMVTRILGLIVHGQKV